MKLGIVGLPNVGKSTLFNSLTKAGAESANYPFCTIDPNVGVVAVPDDRLDKLAALYNSAKITPAVIEFVDIAGLVKGCLLYTSYRDTGILKCKHYRTVNRNPRTYYKQINLRKKCLIKCPDDNLCLVIT